MTVQPLVGSEAPDFIAEAVYDQEFQTISLSQYRVTCVDLKGNCNLFLCQEEAMHLLRQCHYKPRNQVIVAYTVYNMASAVFVQGRYLILKFFPLAFTFVW